MGREIEMEREREREEREEKGGAYDCEYSLAGDRKPPRDGPVDEADAIVEPAQFIRQTEYRLPAPHFIASIQQTPP